MRPLLAVAVVLAAPAAAQDAYQPVALTAVQARADVALLRRGLEAIHPGLYRYRTKKEIDAAFRRLETAAAKPTTDLALWRAVAEMVAEVRCDHSKPEPSAAIEKFRDTHATMLPFRFQLIEGRMIVVSADGQPGAPARGSEVVAINGRAVPVLLAELARAVSYDGTTDGAIASKLGADSDLTGDDLNEFWPSFYGFADRWDVEWKRPGDRATSRSSLAPIAFARWTALPWPGETYRNEFYKAVTWRVAGKAAYLRIDTFVNYRNPVDATGLLSGFFRTMNERGTEHLILDLRANGGGSSDVSVALGRYLLPAPFTWYKPIRYKAIRYGDLPEHIDSWGDRKALFEPPESDFVHTPDGWWDRIPRADNPDDEGKLLQQLAPERFVGRLTLLGGPANGSGATTTLAHFAAAGAKLVGQDTGGSVEGPTAGYVFLLTLPNSGLKVRIASAWNRSTLTRFTPGKGVAADEPVLPTLADFLGSRDRALDVAKAAAPAPAAPGIEEFVDGRWKGMLDYRDFGSDRRVTLPLTAAAAGTTLNAVIDDGPDKIVRSAIVMALDASGRTLTVNGDRFAVRERRASADRKLLTLVATGRGEENGAPVDVQMSIVRDGKQLTITRATRRGNAPLVMRHSYWLERQG